MENAGKSAVMEYIAECREMLERITLTLARLEKGDGGADAIASLYRDFHTIKGSSQLFGYAQIGQVAHAIETSLDPIRKGSAEIHSGLIDVIYAGVDVMGQILAAINAHQAEPDFQDQLAKLVPKLTELTTQLLKADINISKDVQLVEGTVGATSPRVLAENVFSIPRAKTEDSAPKPARDVPVVPVAAARGVPKTAADESSAETIRIHVDLLDKLMNTVGELVLIRNQLLQNARSTEDVEFTRISQRLNVVTGELQSDVMKTRMQPLGNILSKFTRVVRDLSKELGKQVDLHMDGVETELDKTLIEAVKDPLTHIIRNSVDHGIEMPADRQKAGKPVSGSIRVRAFHESGYVIIEIVDDGKGLNKTILGSKAVEKGIITQEQLGKMSERDIQALIFAPGFSTASEVSSLSGRGVGMDVVRTNIERIGGVVDLSSYVGKGTTIRLKIPLTLAIVPALLVREGKSRFAIPQVKLVELFRVESGQATGGIEMLQGNPIFRLRGKVLPLVRLSMVLGLDSEKTPVVSNSEAANIVVLQGEGQQFGLIVEEIEDSADIVVKPLSQFLKGLNVFSGATILGTGEVALAIDVAGVAAACHLTVDSEAKKSVMEEERKQIAETCEYLSLDLGVPGNYVVPLSFVSRLEEIKFADVEYSGHTQVVRYRGDLLPVVDLCSEMGLNDLKKKGPTGTPTVDQETFQLVVVKRGSRQFGLSVRSILDVFTASSDLIKANGDKNFILGTLIDSNKVLVVVDVFAVLSAFVTKWMGQKDAEGDKMGLRSRFRIMVTEDSAVFRSQFRQILTDAGYSVETYEDGQLGYDALSRSRPGRYALLLSDIEMPNLTGLELAKKVRTTEAYKGVPMVAVSTRCADSDVKAGMEAGFTKYLAKLNAEEVIGAVDGLLGVA